MEDTKQKQKEVKNTIAEAVRYRNAKRLANKLCKNNTVKWGGHKIEVEGCKQPRRNGSKYCQLCSDAHAAL